MTCSPNSVSRRPGDRSGDGRAHRTDADRARRPGPGDPPTRLDEGNAAFETDAPTWEEAFDAAKPTEHRLTSPDDGDQVLGRAAVAPLSDRCAYAGAVERSLYVHPDAPGRGVGLGLLTPLLASTGTAGVWTVRSGILPEDTAGLAPRTRAGFRVIGTRERIGRRRGKWRDAVLVERRSPT